jgi:Transposase DDE domain
VFLAILKTYAACSNARLGCIIADAAAKGYLRHAYHYNAISRLHTDVEMTPILVQLAEEAAVPLRSIGNGQYAVDSSGMSNVVHCRWLEHRHGEGQPYRRWTKLHICACTVTHGITAVAVYPDLRGDSPELLELVNRTRQRFDVREVSADTAYSASANYASLRSGGSSRTSRSESTPR